MPERGKCQACGRYADLERVELRVRGVVHFDHEVCRACAFLHEEAVREAFTDAGYIATGPVRP